MLLVTSSTFYLLCPNEYLFSETSQASKCDINVSLTEKIHWSLTSFLLPMSWNSSWKVVVPVLQGTVNPTTHAHHMRLSLFDGCRSRFTNRCLLPLITLRVGAKFGRASFYMCALHHHQTTNRVTHWLYDTFCFAGCVKYTAHHEEDDITVMELYLGICPKKQENVKRKGLQISFKVSQLLRCPKLVHSRI